MNLILPEQVDSRPVLNLARYHTRHEHGDITVYSTWYGPHIEPCLVIFPTRFLGQDHYDHGARPVVIPLTQISIFVEDPSIGDRDEASRIAGLAAQALLLGDTVANRRRLLGLIADHLQDLVTIPPRPRENEEVRAILVMTDINSGKITEKEVRDDV